ncbi:DNA-binding response regulator, NarL/FixJ family, contains REC and HTH domains [Raineyella antarctica]|uniref:DNA-binding response regulator, NarL/FixJ family, contains REC and HTH domains n=1 Tax=Raineyella antarctica TaxID=1577474 RepID=A0A1G6H629_9ACTN|nr:response regulator transcription factor [Raineyella antarctica]SDB89719.1 DNA-binding response regulator, NarL/FixJ family, contains REC and HTH domains [Raineyella antarctica]
MTPPALPIPPRDDVPAGDDFSTGTGTIRVLIADDQPLVRMGLRALVEAEPDMDVIGEAGTGREAVDQVRRDHPDVVLMDVRMPELDGIAALREIGADPRCASTRVVVLTTFELDEYVFAALQAGAAGFLVKDAEPEEILRGIRLAASGASLLSPSVTRTVIATFTGSNRTSPQDERLAVLTDREREVLALVGQGFNNEEIAAELVVSNATARTHVSHIMAKVGARDRPQLVVLAYRTGLVR